MFFILKKFFVQIDQEDLWDAMYAHWFIRPRSKSWNIRFTKDHLYLINDNLFFTPHSQNATINL